MSPKIQKFYYILLPDDGLVVQKLTCENLQQQQPLQYVEKPFCLNVLLKKIVNFRKKYSIWDIEKNKKLISERGISFEQVEKIILDNKYIDILENPTRETQDIFIINLNDYIHIVPFVIDDKDNIVLKTVFPSRKFNKIYRGNK